MEIASPRRATALAPNLARLKKRVREAGVPAIYVNDNFGDWRSVTGRLLAHCLRPDAPGCDFREKIKPAADDYFVLKGCTRRLSDRAWRSAATSGASALIFAGLTTNSCILCSAPFQSPFFRRKGLRLAFKKCAIFCHFWAAWRWEFSYRSTA